MKRITVILLFISLTATAQDYDSLQQKILKMDVAINNIHFNMEKAHKQFKTGTMLMITGTALTVVGALLMRPEPGDLPDQNPSPAWLYIGGGLMTLGTVIQIDSHKWIGQGGRRRR